MTISIKRMSIIDSGDECIVNAANESLMMGGGVCGAIFAAAGETKLQKACDKIGYCRSGDAVITEGFDLCRYIIHAVGPIYINGFENEPQLLYSCYKSSLDLAREYGITSICFPLISAGIFGYPMEKAWKKALHACMDWEKKNHDYDLRIDFALIDEKVYETGLEVYKSLQMDEG